MRGLSSLLILEKLMRYIKQNEDRDDMPIPCEYFDLIGGTSTSG